MKRIVLLMMLMLLVVFAMGAVTAYVNTPQQTDIMRTDGSPPIVMTAASSSACVKPNAESLCLRHLRDFNPAGERASPFVNFSANGADVQFAVYTDRTISFDMSIPEVLSANIWQPNIGVIDYPSIDEFSIGGITPLAAGGRPADGVDYSSTGDLHGGP